MTADGDLFAGGPLSGQPVDQLHLPERCHARIAGQLQEGPWSFRNVTVISSGVIGRGGKTAVCFRFV